MLIGLKKGMAERVGFEPTLEFPLNTLSKRAPSATRPSLQEGSDCLLEFTIGVCTAGGIREGPALCGL